MSRGVCSGLWVKTFSLESEAISPTITVDEPCGAQRRRQQQEETHAPDPSQRGQLYQGQEVHLRIGQTPPGAVRPAQRQDVFVRHPGGGKRQRRFPRLSSANEEPPQQYRQSEDTADPQREKQGDQQG